MVIFKLKGTKMLSKIVVLNLFGRGIEYLKSIPNSRIEINSGCITENNSRPENKNRFQTGEPKSIVDARIEINILQLQLP